MQQWASVSCELSQLCLLCASIRPLFPPFQAVDALSDPGKRRDYDHRLKQEEAGGGLGGSGGSGGSAAAGSASPHFDAGSAPGASGGPREMDMPCRACGRSHSAIITELDV